jgi:hypothetical protein
MTVSASVQVVQEISSATTTLLVSEPTWWEILFTSLTSLF